MIEFARLLRSRMITDPELINDLAIPEGIRDVCDCGCNDCPRLPQLSSPSLPSAAPSIPS